LKIIEKNHHFLIKIWSKIDQKLMKKWTKSEENEFESKFDQKLIKNWLKIEQKVNKKW